MSTSHLPSLYGMTKAIAEILDSDEAGDLLEAEIDRLLPAIQTKAAGLASWIEYHEDLIAAIREREKKVAEARRALEAKTERWRHYLRDCMRQADIDRIVDPQSGRTIRLQPNPPRVEIADGADIPAEYLRVPPPPPPQPDKKAIADALKTGRSVPGCSLVQDVRVVIR